jgi:hypothetical protein
MKTVIALLLIGLLAGVAFAEEAESPASTPASDAEYVTEPFSITFIPSIRVGGREKVIKIVSLNILAGAASKLNGVELGGLANIEAEDVRGAQLAGIVNVVGDGVRGAQLAGIANVIGGGVHGVQLAGVANVVGGSVSGIQFAGTVNAVDDTADSQISGVVNIAKHSTGLQLGVVNFSETNDGYPVGYFSYVKSNPLRVRVWGDEMGFINVGLKSGSERFMNMLVLGVQPEQIRKPFRWIAGAGVGFQTPLGPTLVNTSAYWLTVNEEAKWSTTLNQLLRAQVTAGYKLGSRLSIVCGLSWNILFSRRENGEDLAPWTSSTTTSGSKTAVMWPGFILGLEL